MEAARPVSTEGQSEATSQFPEAPCVPAAWTVCFELGAAAEHG